MSGGKSQSESSGQGSSQNQTFVDPSQMPFLNYLREQGQGLAQQQMGEGSGFQQGVVDPAMGAWQGALQMQQNPFLQGQVQQGQELINRNFQENIMPTIGSGAAGAGQRGSSRQGIAEGIASRSAIESQANFAENIYSQDYQQQQGRMMQALGMSGQMSGLGFSPLQNLQQLLGNPTILGQGQSQQTSDSNSKSMNAGFL